MNENIKFFDKNADIYERSSRHAENLNFKKIIDFSIRQNTNQTLLDIGGGSGGFAKFIKKNYPTMAITIMDPSQELLKRISDTSIECVVGSLPFDTNIKNKYNYIHMKHVAHHIVGNSIKESKNYFKESLLSIKDLLKDDGIFLFQDYYYESYIKKEIARDLIFHMLNVQNRIGIKIPSKEFLINLKICFYTKEEIHAVFDECGFQVFDELVETLSTKGIKQKALLLENYGGIQIAAKIKKGE